MDHVVLLPKEHLKVYLIKKITIEILDCINPDSVYLSGSTTTGPEIVFTIFIDTMFTRPETDLQLIADRILKPYESVAYRLFSCNHAEDLLHRGNLYLLTHCTLGKLVYASETSGHALYPDATMVSGLLVRIKKWFVKRKDKLNDYNADVSRFVELEKYIEAVCLLHKMLELLFKTAESFLMGRELQSKAISEHQNYIRVFAPSLGGLFNTANEADDRLQLLLHSAYRDRPHLNISRTDVERLCLKVEWAQQEVSGLFEAATLNCEDKA